MSMIADRRHPAGPSGSLFGSVFGGGRGRVFPKNLPMPACPLGRGKQPELAAVKRSSTWWEIGWYGSPWTFQVMLDYEDGPRSWVRHVTGFASEQPLTLTVETPGAERHVSWQQLPGEVQVRVIAEVARKRHRRSGTTNAQPLKVG